MAPLKKAGGSSRADPPKSEQDFPIVGIGASAGGLDAFKRFLKAIPEDSGMAYVLVQHLDPSHESLLPDILSRVTTIPVNEVSEDIHLAPNHIYVMPANKTLTSIDGVLQLTPRKKIKTNLAIDVFFKSLAEVHKSLAVGVVLSGTASDGTMGLKAIKEHGGTTFAQDQRSAAYGDMPQNAVNADVVDFILPPEKMPAKLLQVMGENKADKVAKEKHLKSNEVVFQQIMLLLRQYSGVDFTYYKQTTIRRRIARRMALSRKTKLAGYLDFLRDNKAEENALFQDMLIQVTTFFRDPKIFQTISEKVFPALLKNKTANEPIRIWVAACSSGEEAYSLAIALHEFFGDEVAGRQIKIFASDISEVATAKARKGMYRKAEFGNISESILKNYFTRNRDEYQVNRNIRDMCVFTVHNFLKDPPFAKMDMITCRNVLIYMELSLQKKALATFHYALRAGGFLLLGKSETTSPASELFTPFSKHDKIYLRNDVPGRLMYLENMRSERAVKEKEEKMARPESPSTDFRKSAEITLLTKYTPASVIVNEQMDVVHIHKDITPFLEPPQGKPTFNILKMAREGLAFELRNALHKVKTSGKPCVKDGIPVKINGKTMLVGLEIVPLANTREPYFLILFTKSLPPGENEYSGKNTLQGKIHKEHLQRIAQLENELAQTHEDMRSITDDQEASNEELQSANEELLSSSEELQSLNEELETAKEELQSSNEELIIINQELLDTQDEINTSRQFTEAIVATIREPLAVLDKLLCIKTINASFAKKFNITEQEAAGKKIDEIKDHLFDNSALRVLLEKVLSKKKELIDFEICITLPPFGKCTMLLNARHVINEKSKEQLILLAIDDITERKIAQERMVALSAGLEDKIRERTAMLEQTNIQLEQFAHTASHELQEPLRKIATFTKILKQSNEENKPEKVKQYLDKIELSSTRLTQLVGHLLDFASVSQHEHLFEKTDLNQVFKNTLDDFELSIAQKKARITIHKLPTIEAVPFQMSQLFYDLLSNALKFSKPDVPPVIDISSRKVTKADLKAYPHFHQKGTYYEIIFKDNGIGFDQKYAKQIFIMFQRLSSAVMYAGTGIGLAICKKTVENYQGEIFAVSQANKGAAFHIILPVQQLGTKAVSL